MLIQKERDEIENKLRIAYEKKAEEIRVGKERECKLKLAEIEKDFAARKKKLEDYFNNNHEEWEATIFNSIIGR